MTIFIIASVVFGLFFLLRIASYLRYLADIKECLLSLIAALKIERNDTIKKDIP